MTETTDAAVTSGSVDLGQGLSALLRRYLDGARGAVEDLPGGPRGFQVLATSAEGACSNQAGIATRLGIDRTVMTYLVDDLERAGLVSRRPDPADRRARQVVLTEEGEIVLAATSRRIRSVEADVLGALTTEEAEVFRRLLASAAADAPPVDHSECGAPAC